MNLLKSIRDIQSQQQLKKQKKTVALLNYDKEEKLRQYSTDK